jgi:hypothetical protein
MRAKRAVPPEMFYPVAKEAPSTESHAHVTQITEDILKSIQGCGILFPKSAEHARPLIGCQRHG